MRAYVEDIQQHEQKYFEKLFALLRQESISADGTGIRECAELVADYMRKAGLQPEIIETNGHPVVYGERMIDEALPTILFYGHYDVQPPDPLDEWVSPPFEPSIRDGKLFARGVGDNKGQFLCHLLAFETMLRVDGELPCNVKMVVEGEEESGSPNLEPFVATHKEKLAADLVYTSDGPMHSSGAPFVLLGVRGMLYVEFTARGAKWDNHSGNKGNIAPNPAWDLVYLLNTMRDESGRVTIEGFYDDVLPVTEIERNQLRALPYDAEEVAETVGVEKIRFDGEEYYERLTLEPTCNIAGFHSGYGGPGSKTIIPKEAMLKMDFRLVANQDPVKIFEAICAHVKKHAPLVDVRHHGYMYPSRTSSEYPLVQAVIGAVETAYRQPPVLQPSLGGSLPDAVWTKTLGTPSVIVPYANSDEANHSPNENMNVDLFPKGILCTCSVLAKIAK